MKKTAGWLGRFFLGRARGVGGLIGGMVMALPLLLRADQTLTFDGMAPLGGPDHFYVPFQVPAGVREIEIHHDNQSAVNILDWGVVDQNGYRGWGGGTGENAVLGEQAASRAYVPGPIAAGQWKVVVGKAKIIQSPATYHLEITLRDTPTLMPQPERTPYVQAPPLRREHRYYAGDLHAHSLHSTDARPTLEEMVALAQSRGLDFLVISDHNTVTQLDFFAQVQRQHPDLLLVPGIEVTTYAGHAGAIGATHFVEHKIGLSVPSFTEVAAAVHGQGALLSINHPVLDLGDVCIGCAWKHDLDGIAVDAVEIGTGGQMQGAVLFTPGAIKFWEGLLGKGRHVAAVGGSDDHLAGKGTGRRDSPIGDPTTLIFAEELSVPAILGGLQGGRTVVKLQGPSDPMIELGAGDLRVGDTLSGRSAILTARIKGGLGGSARFVTNGVAEDSVVIDADPFVLQRDVTASRPASQGADGSGEDRFRVEVIVDNQPRTVTSPMYFRYDPSGPDPVAERDRPAEAGCSAGIVLPHGKIPASRSAAALGCLAAALLLLTRRRSTGS